MGIHGCVVSGSFCWKTSGICKRHCKIYLIQGTYDPHPVKGVMIPLEDNNVPCEVYVLKKCGHSPFMEKYAKDEFYNILNEIIS